MKVMRAPWRLENGAVVDLITPAEFDTLPDGTKLTCIDGTHVIKNQDLIDKDTRMGMLAYGILRTDVPTDLGAYEKEI